jgi:hypothetical protein
VELVFEELPKGETLLTLDTVTSERSTFVQSSPRKLQVNFQHLDSVCDAVTKGLLSERTRVSSSLTLPENKTISLVDKQVVGTINHLGFLQSEMCINSSASSINKIEFSRFSENVGKSSSPLALKLN